MTDSADIVISADSHVLEPKDLWIRALGPKYGEGVPRYVEGYGGNPGLYFFTGRHALKVGSSRDTDQVERYQKLETAGRDPAVRLGIMDAERVHAEVLNASWAMLTTSILDAALRRDCARVFNDYLVEYCAAAKKRLIGVALVPIEDVDWALHEIERVAAQGISGVMVPLRPMEGATPYRDPRYDRVWASLAEKHLPVTLHSGTGWVADPSTHYNDIQTVPRAFIEFFNEAAPVLAEDFIFGGILDRSPTLQLYLVEFDASWLPIFRYRAERIEKYPGLAPLKKPAGRYLAENVHVGFINDPLAAKLRAEIGIDRMMWGSDFPHPPCPYPNIRERLDTEILAGVPADERTKLVADNVRALYQIEI